jgi:hypothetical protein
LRIIPLLSTPLAWPEPNTLRRICPREKSRPAIGDVARVTYGDRIRELATDWGLVLPSL